MRSPADRKREGVRDGDEEQRRNAWIALAAVAGITAVDLLTAASLTAEQSERKGETGRDYSDRSGFPGGVAKARGSAEGFTPVDFQVTATQERRRWGRPEPALRNSRRLRHSRERGNPALTPNWIPACAGMTRS